MIRIKELHKFQESKGKGNGLSLNVSKFKGNKENEFKGKKTKQYSSNDLVEGECYDCHKKSHFMISCEQN